MSEAFALSDAMTTSYRTNIGVADVTTLGEALLGHAGMAANVVESVAAGESLGAMAVMVVDASETTALVESIVATLQSGLWPALILMSATVGNLVLPSPTESLPADLDLQSTCASSLVLTSATSGHLRLVGETAGNLVLASPMVQ